MGMVASAAVISYAMNRVLPGEPTRNQRLVIACLAMTLAVSPGGQVYLPWGLGAAPNLAVAIAVVVLGAVAKRNLWPLPAELRTLAGLSLGLAIWAGFVSVISPYPATSFRYWIKGLLFGAFFWTVLGLCRVQVYRRLVEWTALFFLTSLAIFGLLETAAPDLALFSWLRTPHSLTIRPRVASVLSWPNTLGVLMVVGLALSEALRAASRISAGASTALTSLFVLLAAQSGSRNAWTVLAVALALLVLRRQLGLRRGLGIAVLFALCLTSLPVARFQVGVLDSAALPVSRQHATTGRAPTSLADPLLSLSLRNMLWNEGLRRWQNRPVQGIGLGVFSTHMAPTLPGNTKNQNLHSLPLNILVETGVPGLLLSFMWLRSVMSRVAGHTSLVALMVALVAQIVDNFLYDPSFTLVFLMLAAATASNAAEMDAEPAQAGNA